MIERQFAPAAERNSEPLLGVLRHELASATKVFEVGSGTGQHAVFFGRAMPHLTWQTSDLAENHEQIVAHLQHAGLSNVQAPLPFDASNDDDHARCLPSCGDAMFSCNTAHIMSWTAVLGMISFAGKALPPGGRFVYYGPFQIGGRFNTQSNRDFDASLTARHPHMGIRDLEQVSEHAARFALSRERWYAVPANNYVVVWQKREIEQS